MLLYTSFVSEKKNLYLSKGYSRLLFSFLPWTRVQQLSWCAWI